MTEVLIDSFIGTDTIDTGIWKIHPTTSGNSAIYQTFIDFFFSNYFELQASTPYCITLEIQSGTYVGGVDSPRIIGVSAGGHGGNRGVYSNGAWLNYSADYQFYI